MYKRMLVPMDGSKLSEQVLPYVRTLGRALWPRVELLQVVPASDQEETPQSGNRECQSKVNRHTQSLNYLESIKALLNDLEVKTSCIVDLRDPGHCIARIAEEEQDTLITIATHGRLGIARWVLGSVMDRVLRAANKPMLVIRPRDDDEVNPEAKARLNSIIVPLDGSSLAEAGILPHVIALTRALDLDVILLMVASDGDEAGSRDYLQKVRVQLSRHGITSVQELVRRGQPGDTIIGVAGESKDSLVAITTHGRSGIRRLMRREGDTLMLGSIADRVIHHCSRPVLVVRNQA